MKKVWTHWEWRAKNLFAKANIVWDFFGNAPNKLFQIIGIFQTTVKPNDAEQISNFIYSKVITLYN